MCLNMPDEPPTPRAGGIEVLLQFLLAYVVERGEGEEARRATAAAVVGVVIAAITGGAERWPSPGGVGRVGQLGGVDQ